MGPKAAETPMRSDLADAARVQSRKLIRAPSDGLIIRLATKELGMANVKPQRQPAAETPYASRSLARFDRRAPAPPPSGKMSKTISGGVDTKGTQERDSEA